VSLQSRRHTLAFKVLNDEPSAKPAIVPPLEINKSRLLIDENVLHDLIDDVLSPYYSLSSHSLGSLAVNFDMKAQTYNFSRPILEFLY
jgi:hypothetical protein